MRSNKGLVAAILMGFVGGCTPTVTVDHEVPQLDALGAAAKKIVIENCKPRPTLAMPPLPDKARIQIDGTTLHADDGGIQILRAYVQARQRLKP